MKLEITHKKLDNFKKSLKRVGNHFIAQSKASKVFSNGFIYNIKPLRLAYLIHHQKIPANLSVHNTCGVKNCINPQHLTTKTRINTPAQELSMTEHPLSVKRQSNQKPLSKSKKAYRIKTRSGLIFQKAFENISFSQLKLERRKAITKLKNEGVISREEAIQLRNEVKDF